MAFNLRTAVRVVVCTGLLLSLGMAAARLAVAQQPVAPANGALIYGTEVVLRWTLPDGRYTRCVQWASRPETTYQGGPFLVPGGSECLLGARDVAYLLDDLELGTYYWHVQSAPNVCLGEDPDYCPNEYTWGPTAYFNSVEPPPPPAPTGCSRRAAKHFAEAALLPFARRHYPRHYKHVGIDDWYPKVYCRNLTSDRVREMIVQLHCCTGGSPSPWAVFKHDREGQWRMAYAQIRDTVFQLRFRGRSVRTMLPAPYEGACTTYVRYRVVRWGGARFRSNLTRRQRTRSGC